MKKITPPWRYPQNNHTLHRHFFPALAEGFPDNIHYSLPPPDPAFSPGSSGSTGFSVPRPGYTDTAVHCGYNYSTVPAYHMQTRTDLTGCGLPSPVSLLLKWSSILVTFTLKKIIDWNISFQTVSCIHLMNVDVYDCNSHIHNPTCFHLTLDLFQTDSVI